MQLYSLPDSKTIPLTFSTTSMPKDFSRPTLSTSVADFALPQSPGASSSSFTLDDSFITTSNRSRRPSYLVSKSNSLSEGRPWSNNSPLASSFTLQPSPPKARAFSHPRRGSSVDETIRMRSANNSPPSNSSSESVTPLLGIDDDLPRKRPRGMTVNTPPRKSNEGDSARLYPKRRLSHPVRSLIHTTCFNGSTNALLFIDQTTSPLDSSV